MNSNYVRYLLGRQSFADSLLNCCKLLRTVESGLSELSECADVNKYDNPNKDLFTSLASSTTDLRLSIARVAVDLKDDIEHDVNNIV